MNVKQLNAEQKRKLKIKFREELDGHVLNYDDENNIDKIVSDGEIYSYYKDVEFYDEF